MKSSATIWMVYKSTSGSCFTGFIDMGSWFRDTCSGGWVGGGQLPGPSLQVIGLVFSLFTLIFLFLCLLSFQQLLQVQVV